MNTFTSRALGRDNASIKKIIPPLIDASASEFVMFKYNQMFPWHRAGASPFHVARFGETAWRAAAGTGTGDEETTSKAVDLRHRFVGRFRSAQILILL